MGIVITDRIAVIGLGRWGRHYVRVLTALGATVVACHTRRADDDARWLAEHHPTVRHTTSLSEALDDQVDGVAVVVPRQSHADLTMACLRRGVHVLVEKPAVTTRTDVDRIHGEARTRGLVLHTGYTHRFDSSLRQMVSVARRTAAPGWQFTWRKPSPGVGVADLIWEYFPHVFSIAELFGGDEAGDLRPTRVRAVPGPRGTGTVAVDLPTRAGPWRVVVSSDAGARQKHIDLYDGGRLVAEWSDRHLHDHRGDRVLVAAEEPLLCQVRDFLRAVQAPRPGTYHALDALVTSRLVELSTMAGPSAATADSPEGSAVSYAPSDGEG